MSKPFIVSHTGSLKALPGWLKQQSFSSYSVSFDRKPMISLQMGSGRSRARMQGVLVSNEGLFDAAENMVREHLGMEPLATN